MKLLFALAFVFCGVGISFSQEVKWKIICTETDQGKLKYEAILTQVLSESDCESLKLTFSQKEGITVLEVIPGTNRIVVKALKQVRSIDIRDIIVMAGFEVQAHSANPESERK